MSLLVGRIDSFLTFNDWLLTEAIKPLKVEYGSNPPLFNDSKIIKYLGDINGTCFISDGLLYTVQYSKYGEIAFGVNSKIPKDIAEFSRIKFSDNKIASKSALYVFNKVFYVLIEVLKEQKRDVFFSPANSTLDNIYSTMIRNRFFNDELNKIGYSNIFSENNIYKINYNKEIKD